MRDDSSVTDTHDRPCERVVLTDGQLWDAIKTSAPPFKLTTRQHDRQAGGVHSRCVSRIGRDETMPANGNFQQAR